MLLHEELTGEIRSAAIEVHRTLGPGLLERAYEECLCEELCQRRLAFQRQLPLAISYKGKLLDCGFVVDLLVEEKVILELKSIERVLPVHEAQLLTYLKLTGVRVGLLINFNTEKLIDGIIRRVL